MAEAHYGDRIAVVEPYSIEHIPPAERHGRSRQLFWLWLAANLTIADYAIGFLPVALGLPLGPTIFALALGNVLGGAVLAWSAAMGPSTGFPQMFIGRRAFGRVGGYVPAALNWISTVGWFTVNSVLGAFAVQLLIGGLAFWVAALVLVAVQALIVVYGHNFIQAFERWLAGVLAVLFAIATVLALTHTTAISRFAAKPGSSQVALFAVVLAVSFSYVMSWSPYASDYSRYLPERTSRRAISWYVFAGAALASFWVETVGVLIAILAPGATNPVAALKEVMGWFGPIAVIAVILGATTANALNLYSNSMSARVLDVKLPRWHLVIVGALIGFILAVIAGTRSFTQDYTNFLLLLDYWIMPWLAVVLLDFYWLKQRAPAALAGAPRWNPRGGLAYLVGLLASVPFMVPEAIAYRGPLAGWFGGADFSYFVGFLVAGIVYVALNWQDRLTGELANLAAARSDSKD